MAKKRKASRQPEAPSGPKDYDPQDARLGPITTHEDVADEQEEYFMEKDKIMFDDEPGTKRQRKVQKEDAFLDLSDDEVLGADSDDSENESVEDDSERKKQKKKAKKAANKKVKLNAKTPAKDSDAEDDDVGARNATGDGDDGDQGWWGSSRKEYYDGETIETEANALEEEAEARRLQKKQLSRMTAADFFDMDDWTPEGASASTGDQGPEAATKGEDGGVSGNVVTVTMKTDEEIDSMTREEQYKYLQALYPEIDHLCDEFIELEPLLNEFKAQAEGKTSKTLEVIQFRVLSCYLATIALYFSLLMSPTRDNPGGPKRLMDPEELHDHEVMEYLVDCRQTWEWVKRVQIRRATKAKKTQDEKTPATAAVSRDLRLLDDSPEVASTAAKKTKSTKYGSTVEKEEKATSKKQKKNKRPGVVSKDVEESMADLSDLLSKQAKKTKKLPAAPSKAAANDGNDDQSDLGEEETIDARTAEEKLKRKKTLGFYTSQIMQKANLRSGAGGQSGGDLDIPYRERLRDRQARLNAAAVRRGQSAIVPGEELGGDDDDDEDGDGGADEREDNLKYYNSIVQAHQQKIAAKAARKAEVEAGKLDRVLPEMSMDKDGRRQLTWEIEKNKGLSHRTMKEKKNNPRVKKRMKFEKKKKQLASMRAVYKPVDRDNYQGERTGINTGLVRSIKLS